MKNNIQQSNRFASSIIPTFLSYKKESSLLDSPPAAGCDSGTLPFRRSAILAERFCFHRTNFPMKQKRKLPFPHRKQLPRHDYHRHIICCKILASPCQKITCKAPLCASHNINSTINFPTCQPLSLSFCTISFLFKVDLCIFTSILPAIFPYINLLFSVNTPSMTSINATIAYIPVKRRHYAVFFRII